MGPKRKHQRFTKRLQASFSSGGLSYRGILSNISEKGLFIRTNRGFAPNTIIDIELVMPDNRLSRLKGIVRRTIKTPVSTIKNGMGIELIERDETFMNLVSSFNGEPRPERKEQASDFQIVFCKNCRVKNVVFLSRLSQNPRCGKCGTPLTVPAP
ncbi:MAG: PilZ domain-containing protein [Nitrospirota bacterium]